MPVRKLNDAQKRAVVTIYTSIYRPKSIKELARFLCVSPRTIGRVLEEAGVTKVMRILNRYKYTSLMMIRSLEVIH
jgi:transcriptional regulator GlxA family with amidase domain